MSVEMALVSCKFSTSASQAPALGMLRPLMLLQPRHLPEVLTFSWQRLEELMAF
jgi:hypothetical protein